MPSGYSVKAVFSHFNTEEHSDYLRIYDGPSASSPLLVKLSGDLSTPRGVVSTGSSLWFNFLTNEIASRRGFEATFTAGNSSLSGKRRYMDTVAVIIPLRENNPGNPNFVDSTVPLFSTRHVHVNYWEPTHRNTAARNH